MDNLQCTGDEDTLWNCGGNSWGDNNCAHGEDVGIICDGSWTVGNVRLVPDTDPIQGAYSGRLEVFYNGEWGTVCDDVFDGSNNGPEVVCRQLNLPWTDASQYDSAGEGQIWLDNLNCDGTEDSIEYCQGNAWGDNNCGHGEDVGIICEGTFGGNTTEQSTLDGTITNGDWRIVLDPSQGEFAGILEFFYERQWGTVCDDVFDGSNTGPQVACKSLGLPW